MMIFDFRQRLAVYSADALQELESAVLRPPQQPQPQQQRHSARGGQTASRRPVRVRRESPQAPR